MGSRDIKGDFEEIYAAQTMGNMKSQKTPSLFTKTTSFQRKQSL